RHGRYGGVARERGGQFRGASPGGRIGRDLAGGGQLSGDRLELREPVWQAGAPARGSEPVGEVGGFGCSIPRKFPAGSDAASRRALWVPVGQRRIAWRCPSLDAVAAVAAPGGFGLGGISAHGKR